MSAKPQADTEPGFADKDKDAADYLAAILPELADIARKGCMDDLAGQIDEAARSARHQLHQ